MASTLEDVEAAALALTNEERIALAERLLTSVNFAPGVREAWLDEAERRLERMDSGEDPGLSLEEFWSDEQR
jgi:putative addiction module component (TIGR02574 family)